MICSNSFDMVAESTDDRRVTEAALDSEYIRSGKKEKGMFYLCIFFAIWLQYAAKNSQFEILICL